MNQVPKGLLTMQLSCSLFGPFEFAVCSRLRNHEDMVGKSEARIVDP